MYFGFIYCSCWKSSKKHSLRHGHAWKLRNKLCFFYFRWEKWSRGPDPTPNVHIAFPCHLCFIIHIKWCNLVKSSTYKATMHPEILGSRSGLFSLMKCFTVKEKGLLEDTKCSWPLGFAVYGKSLNLKRIKGLKSKQTKPIPALLNPPSPNVCFRFNSICCLVLCGAFCLFVSNLVRFMYGLNRNRLFPSPFASQAQGMCFYIAPIHLLWYINKNYLVEFVFCWTWKKSIRLVQWRVFAWTQQWNMSKTSLLSFYKTMSLFSDACLGKLHNNCVT